MKPTLIPSSRRFSKDQWHPYGWQVAFRQTVCWPSGRITRHYFSDIGVDKGSAIGNALRLLDNLSEDVAIHSLCAYKLR